MSCELNVNSSHHQAIGRVAEGLHVTAHAPDGIVEGLEDPKHPFYIGVQWHPEDMTAEGSASALFGAFVEAARKYALAVFNQLAEWNAAQEYAEALATVAPSGSGSSTLAAIRSCESGGDYGAVSSSGTYRGAYQFDQATWESMGGSGDPAAAPPAEQDMRAQMLYDQAGSSPWPVCGQ